MASFTSALSTVPFPFNVSLSLQIALSPRPPSSKVQISRKPLFPRKISSLHSSSHQEFLLPKPSADCFYFRFVLLLLLNKPTRT
ncbi:unnamed protein product [Citrullus colocynthis]|uniref:Uncharacterized protein n=1 Tax=Citrullus colocynthis TaxID=252529 RepID=A0ABP0YEE4_9ROSI